MGTVVDFAGVDGGGRPAPLKPGESPSYYVVDLGTSLAVVPIRDSEKTVRKICDSATAQMMLALLRGPSTPALTAEGLLERGKRVVHDGQALEQARFLRELYEIPVPTSPSLSSGLAFLESLVLPELGVALGLDPRDLEHEMRQRYPAARDAANAAKTAAWFIAES